MHAGCLSYPDGSSGSGVLSVCYSVHVTAATHVCINTHILTATSCRFVASWWCTSHHLLGLHHLQMLLMQAWHAAHPCYFTSARPGFAWCHKHCPSICRVHCDLLTSQSNHVPTAVLQTCYLTLQGHASLIGFQGNGVQA